MSAMVINEKNFHQEVLESNKPVLLDFWAPWCAPCRMVVPILDEIAREHPDLKVGKINVDENFELAKQFRVMSIPAIYVVKDGIVVNQAVGARSKQQLINMIK